MVVPDTRIDKLFCEHSLVLGAPYIRFYVARPIHNSENVVIGSISLIDYASAGPTLRYMPRKILGAIACAWLRLIKD